MFVVYECQVASFAVQPEEEVLPREDVYSLSTFSIF
jgi:hypothetical protein